jgi:hypothetical protein
MRRAGGRSLAALWLVGGLGLAILVSACGSSTPDASPPKTTTTDSSATSTTLSAQANAVLAAYRAAWSAFEGALANANPSDPALASTMVDPQLQSVKANLLADQMQGIVGRGPTTLHPEVTALSASSATVVDCAYSSNELVYKATGKPVPPITPPENDGVTATLVLTGGAWKVSKQTVTDGKCVSAS